MTTIQNDSCEPRPLSIDDDYDDDDDESAMTLSAFENRLGAGLVQHNV